MLNDTLLLLGGNNSNDIDRGTYGGKSIVLDGRAGRDYLSQTLGLPTDNNVCTLNICFKRCKLGAWQSLFAGGTDASNSTHLVISRDDELEFYQSGATFFHYNATMVFRDCHRWYNLTIKINTDEAAASDRVRFWVDDEEITAWGTEVNPSLSAALKWNTATAHTIGRRPFGRGSRYYSGYVSRYVFIDGQALDYTSFIHQSSNTDKWVLSNVSGLIYGNNGFLIDHNDDRASTPDTTSTIYDQSSNSNDWQ